MRNKIFISLILVLFSALILAQCSGSPTSDYVKLANAAISRNALKLATKHKMQVVGVGGGLHTNVNMLGVSFQILKPMDQNEARFLFVACMEEFLQNINDDLELQPYLSNFPFTCKNIDLTVFFENPDGTDVYEPNVGAASSSVKGVAYRYNDERVSPAPYKYSLYEPYDEALRIVKEQSPEMLPHA